jgi:hypothetical protein
MLRWLLIGACIVLFICVAETVWSSAQRGKYVISGSAASSQPRGKGQIIVVVGRQRVPSYQEPLPEQELLRLDIRVDFSGLKMTSGGRADSHDTYVSTFRPSWSGTWKESGKPFEMELVVQWNRETDIVKIGESSFDRSQSHEFLIRVKGVDQSIIATQTK